jgi:hypothetical protein
VTFSLRLTADLTLALAARALGAAHGRSVILQLSSEHNFDSALASRSAPQASAHLFQSVARVSRYRSPIIWIGGSEPLDHPQVGRFSNALAGSGRHVFVETSGTSLKQRLHEFRPSSRLCFAVRFASTQPVPDQHTASEAGLRAGLEALRMARLAGFFTCAHLVLHPDGSRSELEDLHAEIQKLDVDGFLIIPAVLTPELQKAVVQLRRRLLTRRWSLISSLLEASLSPSISRSSQHIERHPLPESQPESFGGSAEAG